jgi:septin 3/9/12
VRGTSPTLEFTAASSSSTRECRRTSLRRLETDSLNFFRTGHGLRPIDTLVMKKLSDVVNVVPVIAKSDSLTLEERDLFKERVSYLVCSLIMDRANRCITQIRAEMQYHNIRLFPFDSEEHEEEERELNDRIRSLIPLAVVGSERSVVIDGKAVRGRKSRYGVVNVENENHCEFVYLRNFLTR